MSASKSHRQASTKLGSAQQCVTMQALVPAGSDYAEILAAALDGALEYESHQAPSGVGAGAGSAMAASAEPSASDGSESVETIQTVYDTIKSFLDRGNLALAAHALRVFVQKKGRLNRECFSRLLLPAETEDLMTQFISAHPTYLSSEGKHQGTIFNALLMLMDSPVISYGSQEGKDLFDVIMERRVYFYLEFWLEPTNTQIVQHMRFFEANGHSRQDFYSLARLDRLMEVLDPKDINHWNCVKNFWGYAEECGNPVTVFFAKSWLLKDPDKFLHFMFCHLSCFRDPEKVYSQVSAFEFTPDESRPVIQHFFRTLSLDKDPLSNLEWIRFLRCIAPPDCYAMVLFSLTLESPGYSWKKDQKALIDLVPRPRHYVHELAEVERQLSERTEKMELSPHLSLSEKQEEKARLLALVHDYQRREEEMEKKVSSLKERTEAKRREIDAHTKLTEREIAALEKKSQGQFRMIAEAKAAIQKAEKASAEVESQIAVLQSKITTCEEQIKDQSSTHQQNRDRLNAQITQIEEEILAYQSRILACESEIQAGQSRKVARKVSAQAELGFAISVETFGLDPLVRLVRAPEVKALHAEHVISVNVPPVFASAEAGVGRFVSEPFRL